MLKLRTSNTIRPKRRWRCGRRTPGDHPDPGDMVHFDIKRLVRIQRPSHRVTGNRRDGVKGIGAEFLHIDDHSRSCYKANRFQKACYALGLKHRKTRPDTPPTNGKAERFIQTALREGAYAQTYQNSQQTTAALLSFNHQYNGHRPHASLNQQPTISKARLNDLQGRRIFSAMRG